MFISSACVTRIHNIKLTAVAKRRRLPSKIDGGRRLSAIAVVFYAENEQIA